MTKTDLFWLPAHPDFSDALKELRKNSQSMPDKIRALQNLANHNLDPAQTALLYKALAEITDGDDSAGFPTVRLALLASSTLDHLLPAIHIGALRRGFLLNCYLGAFNQYRQEILTSDSGLYGFKPDVVLVALHAEEVGNELPLDASWALARDAAHAKVDEWVHWWELLKKQSGAQVIHATLVNAPLQFFGQMDRLMPGSPPQFISLINETLGQKAAEHGVLVLDLENLASRIGKYEWCEYALWFHAKQAIPARHAPVAGDTIARLVAAVRGLSKKCLVLDLDNTLWGGVIGDDGVENIILGQGHALGEAFQAFQIYLKQLKNRGVLLAVCSKNSEANARLPFDQHPEMVLKREDFAVFVANWETKTTNLEQIAAQLAIGLDAIVFFDDSAAERALVRQVLPAVSVPEAPEDPAEFALYLSAAGYFEAAAFTMEDAQRTSSYQTTIQQTRLSTPADLAQFLKGLEMELSAAPIDAMTLARAVQLINKSNQFNLTTRRYTEAQVRELLQQPDVLTFQIRLKDRLTDHGIISVLIAKPMTGAAQKTWIVDTWLMSCRVLGRHVEEAALNLLVEQAALQGYQWIVGEYKATTKNELVRHHYQHLGFTVEPTSVENPTCSRWKLNVAEFKQRATPIHATFTQRSLSWTEKPSIAS